MVVPAHDRLRRNQRPRRRASAPPPRLSPTPPAPGPRPCTGSRQLSACHRDMPPAAARRRPWSRPASRSCRRRRDRSPAKRRTRCGPPFADYALGKAVTCTRTRPSSALLAPESAGLLQPRLRPCGSGAPAVVVDLDREKQSFDPQPGLRATARRRCRLARLREAGIAVMWISCGRSQPDRGYRRGAQGDRTRPRGPRSDPADAGRRRPQADAARTGGRTIVCAGDRRRYTRRFRRAVRLPARPGAGDGVRQAARDRAGSWCPTR